MPVYIALLVLPAMLAATESAHRRSPKWVWLVVGVVLVVLIGLRHEVGADWGPYLLKLEDNAPDSLWEALTTTDPGYAVFNWLGTQWGGVYLVNTLCAILFSFGLIAFCRSQPRPWLALVVAVPYLVVVVAMGYSRQGVAIGLAMSALVALERGSFTRFMMWIVVAALFHRSAIVLVPLAVLAGSRRRWLTWVSMLAALATFVWLFVLEALDWVVTAYIDAQYTSAGSWVRILMNALPAVVFLLFRKRFALDQVGLRLWTSLSLAALAFIPILYLSPSSAVVDRMALYLIPLQLVVWSRLPEVLDRGLKPVGKIAVVAYCAAVQIVWLFFADFSFAWLPYQFYPWVFLVSPS